jgi:hypothetical protein
MHPFLQPYIVTLLREDDSCSNPCHMVTRRATLRTHPVLHLHAWTRFSFGLFEVAPNMMSLLSDLGI